MRQRTMNRSHMIIGAAAAVLAGALAACGTSTPTAGSGPASKPAATPSTSRPLRPADTGPARVQPWARHRRFHIYAGHRQRGGPFTGTYLNHAPAMQAGTALRYDVVGIIHGWRFTSTWTAGSVALQVTGRYTPTKIVLDNPGGSFSTTVFRAAANCPAG